MLRLAAEENFDGDVLDGLRRRMPEVDIVRVQDTNLRGAPDPEMLEWAAQEQRILLTHDRATVTRYAYDRVADHLPMPGVVQVRVGMPLGDAIDALELIAGTATAADLDGRVLFVPL